jgi:hypothetical protein
MAVLCRGDDDGLEPIGLAPEGVHDRGHLDGLGPRAHHDGDPLTPAVRCLRSFQRHGRLFLLMTEVLLAMEAAAGLCRPPIPAAESARVLRTERADAETQEQIARRSNAIHRENTDDRISCSDTTFPRKAFADSAGRRGASHKVCTAQSVHTNCYGWQYLTSVAWSRL